MGLLFPETGQIKTTIFKLKSAPPGPTPCVVIIDFDKNLKTAFSDGNSAREKGKGVAFQITGRSSNVSQGMGLALPLCVAPSLSIELFIQSFQTTQGVIMGFGERAGGSGGSEFRASEKGNRPLQLARGFCRFLVSAQLWEEISTSQNPKFGSGGGGVGKVRVLRGKLVGVWHAKHPALLIGSKEHRHAHLSSHCLNQYTELHFSSAHDFNRLSSSLPQGNRHIVLDLSFQPVSNHLARQFSPLPPLRQRQLHTAPKCLHPKHTFPCDF